MVVVWGIHAKKELANIFEYISLESPKNARKVADTIVDLTLSLSQNPLKYPLDKYKKNNDGTWRAFEKYHYRVAYHIMANEIRIVRLRHTSRTPLDY